MAEWKAEVLYNFESTNEVELGLKKGEIVIIRRTSVGEGWFEAEREGARGLIPMKFVRKLSRTNAIKEEGDTSSDDEVAKKTASGESQSSLKGNQTAPSSSSSASLVGSQKQTQPTPPTSKRALMEGLLLPETRTMFNQAKAKEIFVDSAMVKIVGGPAWEISQTPRKRIVVRDAHAEQQSFGSTHTIYEVETKDPPNTVSRRYKHFLWLYDKLAECFPCLSLPPMPVKQFSGNLEPNFVEARRRGLERFINRVARHPVLGASRALHEFLTNKDSKEWKIGSRSSVFTLNRGSSVKKMFNPAIYSAVQYTPHNYSVSQLATVDSFAGFTRLVDVNLLTLQQSCQEMATKTGEMTSALQQVGRDLGRIARGEETVVSMAAQQKKTSGQSTGTLTLYSQGIHRTAAELEEGSGEADFSWGWQPENKEFQSLVNDVAALGSGIEKIAQRCSFQQDILEQSTVSLLQDYSGILHTVPGVVKVHEDAMKVYENSKEKDSKKEAVKTKGYCEALSNIVLAEFSYLHSRLIADLQTTFGEMLAQQAEFHTAMAKRWTDLHYQFTHTDMPCPSPTVVGPSVDAMDGRPMHDYANFKYPRKQPVSTETSEHAEYINYNQSRALLANSGSSSTTSGSSSLPNLTSPPCPTHPKDRQGYEQLRQTMGDNFVFSEPEAVPKTRQEERDEVYVPFTPGQAPLSVKTSRGSPPLKKKAADYMPFVPISERSYKSDPCILDLDKEAALVSGSMPSSLQMSDPELVKLRSKAKHGKEKKPFDYLPFVPLAQMAKSASGAEQESSEEAKEGKGEDKRGTSEGKESVGEEDEVFPPSEHSSCHSDKMAAQEHTAPLEAVNPPEGEGGDEEAPQVPPPGPTNTTSSCSTGEDGPEAVSNHGNTTNTAEESNERHHPVAVEHNPSSSEVAPPQTNTRIQGEAAYAMHRIEAGDSSASSGGESSPSPRVRSVALAGAMCWNGNNNSNNNNRGLKKGLPPEEAVDGSVKHSVETSVPLPPHEDEESSSAAAKQSTKVSAMVQKFQGNPPLRRSYSGQPRKSVDSGRKHRSSTQSASDRLSSSSLKSTTSSSSRSSPPPSHRQKSRKQSRLESMGIVEDTEGGSYAV